MTDWTPEKVRELLPDVPVKDEATGEVATWKVVGRKLPVATVREIGGKRECQVAWATVAHVLNTGSAVRY